jgi:hypothetical protein
LEAEVSGFWRVKTIRNGMVIPEKLWSWWCFSQEWWWWWWREEKRSNSQRDPNHLDCLPRWCLKYTRSFLLQCIYQKGYFNPLTLTSLNRHPVVLFKQARFWITRYQDLSFLVISASGR